MNTDNQSRFDYPRCLAIVSLGAVACTYFLAQGVAPLRAFAAVAAACSALAVLWALEWRGGRAAVEPRKSGKSDFDWGMHYLRGFAIVAILLTHFFGCIGLRWVKSAFFSGSTVFFLFISGYLCQYLALRRPIDTLDYYRKKALNVFAPYLVWSTITIGVVLLTGQDRAGVVKPTDISWGALPNIYLLGWAQAPYWYIPFVLAFFLISPWLTRIRTSRLVWLTVVAFFAAICFPSRPKSHLVWEFTPTALRYVFFLWTYLIGFLYARLKDRIDPYLKSYAIPALLLALVLAIVAIFPKALKFYILSSSFRTSLQKFLFLIPALVLLIRLRNRKIWLFDALAKYSFTLFFTHDFFLRDFFQLNGRILAALHPTVLGIWLISLVLAAAFVGLNLLLAMLLKACLGRHSRYFIGA